MTTPRERAERALRHAPFLGLGKEAVLPLVEQEIIEATKQERERCALRSLAAVDAVLEDLCDRQGLSNEWWQIDPEIQLEIMNAWKDAIAGAIMERQGD